MVIKNTIYNVHVCVKLREIHVHCKFVCRGYNIIMYIESYNWGWDQSANWMQGLDK